MKSKSHLKPRLAGAALLALFLMSPSIAWGQDPPVIAVPVGAEQGTVSQVQTLSLDIKFRQGDRKIDAGYMNNSNNLAVFTATLQNYVYNSNIIVERVDIIGGASIEGTPSLNEDLSRNRARRMVEILEQYTNVPKSLVTVDSRGVNWEDVLEMVQEDRLVPSREEVINILRYVPEKDRKASLESLAGGAPYRYLYNSIFPYVRTGRMTVRFRLVPKTPAGVDTVYISKADTVYHIFRGEGYNIGTQININGEADMVGPKAVKAARQRQLDSLLRVPVVAFRSNLLVPLMNVGVEVPLGNRVSVGADWYYPWMWRHPNHMNCFEFLGGTVEGRVWLGSRHLPGEDNAKYRLLGHSLGLLVGGGYYDFEKEWDGFQGEFGTVGIDYMYALPMGRRGGTHMEFEVAVGVITSRNIPYDVYGEGGILLHRDGLVNNFTWIGPIKAGVNLVVPIFKRTDAQKKVDAERKQAKADAKAQQVAAAEAAAAEAAAVKQAQKDADAQAKIDAANAKQAEKDAAAQAKAEAKAQAEQAKIDAENAKKLAAEQEAAAKQAEKDAVAQAKAEAKAQAEQAKIEAENAKRLAAEQEAAAKQAEKDAAAQAKIDAANAKQAEKDAAAQAKIDAANAKQAEKDAAAQAKAEAKAQAEQAKIEAENAKRLAAEQEAAAKQAEKDAAAQAKAEAKAQAEQAKIDAENAKRLAAEQEAAAKQAEKDAAAQAKIDAANAKQAEKDAAAQAKAEAKAQAEQAKIEAENAKRLAAEQEAAAKQAEKDAAAQAKIDAANAKQAEKDAAAQAKAEAKAQAAQAKAEAKAAKKLEKEASL